MPHFYFLDGQPTVVPRLMQRAYTGHSTVYWPKASSTDLMEALISSPTRVSQLQKPYVLFRVNSIHLCNFDLSVCYLWKISCLLYGYTLWRIAICLLELAGVKMGCGVDFTLKLNPLF